MTDIVIIGAGRMGLPVAARLVAAGNAVGVVDVRPELQAAAAAVGAQWLGDRLPVINSTYLSTDGRADGAAWEPGVTRDDARRPDQFRLRFDRGSCGRGTRFAGPGGRGRWCTVSPLNNRPSMHRGALTHYGPSTANLRRP